MVGMVMCSVLAGCAAPNDSSWWEGWGALASAGDEYQFDFAWELRGDDGLAPLLVFSNAQQLWLQFAGDSQPIPALFALRDGGLAPLQVHRKGIYHVVNERVDVLLLRRGTEQVWAYRTAFAPTLVNYLRQQYAMTGTLGGGAADNGAESSAVSAAVVLAVGADEKAVETMSVAGAGALSFDENVIAFTAHVADHTFRQVLQRWASSASWVFNDEHWTVAVDIPISGPFSYQGSFAEAVQQLLLSTQLGDYPLRPCFYSNQLLRVVQLRSGCRPHTEELAPKDSSDGMQTAYPEQEVFVSLPWVAGSARKRTEGLDSP